MEYISKNEKETFDFAKSLADKATAGDIFALQGDLGSGKTTFVKGFAKALGIKKEITSPTFVFLKQYPIDSRGITLLVHVDCYRISSREDAQSIGLLEFFDREDIILLIEWPERIEELLPERTNMLRFSYIDDKTRIIRKDFV